MSLFDKTAFVSLETNADNFEELAYYFRNQYKSVNSCNGLEVATFVITIAELIVSILSCPTVTAAFEKDKIIVKVEGFKINDTITNVVDLIQQDKELLKLVENKKYSVEGDAKQIELFKSKLRELFEICADDEL